MASIGSARKMLDGDLLIQRALHQMQRVEAQERVRAALIDEAHNVFIPAFSGWHSLPAAALGGRPSD